MSKEKYEEIFNVKIKAAGLKYLEKIADEAPSNDEVDEFKSPSDKLDKKILAALSKFKKRLRLKKGLKTLSITIAAIIFVVSVSCITITSSEALRVKFHNLFVNDSGNKLEISASGGLDEESMPEGSDVIKAGYMPKGYKLIEADISITNVVNTYLNRDNSLIRIIRSQDVGAVALDKENCNNFKTKINGNLAIVMETDVANIILYFSNNYFYHITGEGVATEQLIKIAENLPK